MAARVCQREFQASSDLCNDCNQPWSSHGATADGGTAAAQAEHQRKAAASAAVALIDDWSPAPGFIGMGIGFIMEFITILCPQRPDDTNNLVTWIKCFGIFFKLLGLVLMYKACQEWRKRRAARSAMTVPEGPAKYSAISQSPK